MQIDIFIKYQNYYLRVIFIIHCQKYVSCSDRTHTSLVHFFIFCLVFFYCICYPLDTKQATFCSISYPSCDRTHQSSFLSMITFILVSSLICVNLFQSFIVNILILSFFSYNFVNFHIFQLYITVVIIQFMF